MDGKEKSPDWEGLFNSMRPGFFGQEHIRALPKGEVFTELAMPLERFCPDAAPVPCPERIAFGVYRGGAETLHDAVRRVSGDWVQYFTEDREVFCAFDGERIAGFCIADDFGRHGGLSIGGPGCVGTVPEYRGQGIGLEMVRRATARLKEKGFDLSWIHYTHLAAWYERLGYEAVLRWDRDGLVRRDG